MKKINILFVDNDPEFIKARKKILEGEGYNVITANNPEKAKHLINNDKIIIWRYH